MPTRSTRPVALITGAGSGIGLACVRRLAGEGFDICLVGRDVARLQAAAPGMSTESFICAGDVGNDRDVSHIAEAVRGHYGRLDALIQCAGAAPLLPLELHTPAVIRGTFDTNAVGPAALIAALWPLLRETAAETRRATIVNVSSMASVDPFPGFFAYAASKAAVNLLATVAAKEGERMGIRAFSVAPGAVETPLLRSLFDTNAIPAAKTLSPDFVARVITECVTGTRDAMNGRTIEVPSP